MTTSSSPVVNFSSFVSNNSNDEVKYVGSALCNVKVVISSNPQNLKTELEKFENSATVEAEYGDVCIEGNVMTLAHHGSRSNNPPPCILDNQDLNIDVIGLSHIDLDSLGGVLALLGCKPDCPSFWEAAGLIDINGAHKINKLNISEEDKLRLHAYWAWSENNRYFAPRDGSVDCINNVIEKGLEAVFKIVNNDSEMLEEGKKHIKKGKLLNKASFIEAFGNIVLRSSDSFVSHIYEGLNGEVYDIIVSYNTKMNSVTVSKSDNSVNLNCKDIVQELWGSEAGGHAGIAGSPRNRIMTLEDAKELIRLIQSK